MFLRERVIVTGGTGFIGKYILDKLSSQDKEIHVFSRKKYQTPESSLYQSVVWHNIDLLSMDKVVEELKDLRAAYLLHGAWDVAGSQYWESSNNLEWLSASIGLLKNFVEFGGKRVVGIGTCAEYLWDNSKLIEGLSPCIPDTLYGYCKLTYSNLLHYYCNKFGVSAAWGRLFYVYGPNEGGDKLITSTIEKLCKEGKVACKQPKREVDYIYVKDAAEALARLLFSSVEGNINIGSGKPVKIQNIIEMLISKLNIEEYECDFFSEIVNYKNVVADITRLNSELGFGLNYSLEQGIDEMIAWWKANEISK